MSQLLKTAGFLLLSIFSLHTNAQSISQADQKGVDDCYNAFQTAFATFEAAPLTAWLTESADHINPLGEVIHGRDNIVASFTGLLGFLKTQPKADKVEERNVGSQARYLANDLILYTYTNEATMHYGSTVKVDKLATSVLLRKKGDKWLAEMIALTPVVEMPHN